MKHAFAKAHEFAARHRAALGKVPELFAKAETVGSLYIYEVIGQDWWTGGGVTGKSVVEALSALDGVKTLNIYINSEGGDVFEAKAIYENLVRFQADKVVHVDGIAASAASFVAMAGDTIITAPAATWMIHEAWSVALGRASDMRAMADVLDLENKALAETYAKRTGQTVDQVLQWMSEETWMSAQEAVDRGFSDQIAREGDAGAAAASAATVPALAFATQTEHRVALARQSQRLRQLRGHS